MSTTPPPRRRRIAGERRRASSPSTPADETVDVPSARQSTRQSTRPTAQPPAAPSPGPGADEDQTSSPSRRRWWSRGLRLTKAPHEQKRHQEPLHEGPPRDDEVLLDDERDPEGSGTRRWWGSRQSIVALAVALTIMLTLVVLGALGLLGNTGVPDVREAEDAQVAAESAPSVAERAAEAILAYDHRSLDAGQDAAQRFMTTSFGEEYATTFDKTVKPAARTYRAQVTVDVKGSSVVRATDDRVKVLLFVDQTTQSTAHDQPQVALNRVEFDMVQRDGEWLVDGISSY